MAVRTIATDLKLTGEKEFNDQMKAVNSNLKTLKSDMSAVSAEFDGNADSVDALTAKQKILKDSVEQQRVKIDALRAMYEKVSDAYGENSAQADKWKQQLNQATVALAKETAALEKNESALNAAKSKTEPYVSVIQRMGTQLKKPANALNDFKERVSAAAKETPVLAEAIDIASIGAKGLSTAAKGAGTAVKGIGTAAGTAAGGLAKSVGAISAASAAGVAALGTLGTVALGSMVSMAKEAAEAVKDIPAWKMTESQKEWAAFAKQLDTLDASVANAKSALGGILLPALSDLSTEGAAFLNDFASDMEAAAGDTEKQGKILSDYIVKGAKLIKEKLPEYVKLGKELFSGLGEGLSEAGPDLLDAGLDIVMDLLDEITANAPALAEIGMTLIQKLIEGVIERGPDALKSGVQMVTDIVTGLAQAAPDMIPAAGQLITQLILALIESAPQLLLAGLELVYGIISGISDGIGDIVGSADEIIEAIKTNFGDKAQEFLDIGDNIVRGIWSGISGAKDWILGKLSDWVGDVVDWIKDKLDINSPSGVMEDEVGVWMAKGVGTGWTKEMAKVNKLIANSINTSFDIPAMTSSRAYSGRSYLTSGGNTINLYFTAKTITEADINMVVDIINRKLGDGL